MRRTIDRNGNSNGSGIAEVTHAMLPTHTVKTSRATLASNWLNERPSPKRVLRLGFDLHGVVYSSQREVMCIIMQVMINAGHEIHILTGSQIERVMAKIKRYKIPYTHLFSITDHHIRIGTPITWDKRGNPHMDEYLWDRTKGQYCEANKIDTHFDDSDIYRLFFKTPYARFFTCDTERVKKMRIGALR